MLILILKSKRKKYSKIVSEYGKYFIDYYRRIVNEVMRAQNNIYIDDDNSTLPYNYW